MSTQESVTNTSPNEKTPPCYPYAFEMRNISKAFNNGQIRANIGINLAVKHNEIHALIGENGAGKSTLMSILFGLYEQDEGDIYVNGQKVQFSSSKDAANYKIGMVHQHFKLIDNFTVLDNIILGSEQTVRGFLTRAKARRVIKGLTKQYGFNVNLAAKVGSLTVGQQQKVEILKVLYRESDILIFDEPTAVLSDNEITAFLDILRNLKNAGKTIVIISHKLHEIKAIADTGTVIRKGECIAQIDIKQTSVEKMAELMVGRKIVAAKNEGEVNASAQPLLEVIDLDLTFVAPLDYFASLVNKRFATIKEKVTNRAQNAMKTSELPAVQPFRRVSFQIHTGEVFAVAGVEGNGQSSLAELISGLKPARSGKILFAGKNISFASIKRRNKLGISHVPEDRHKHGLILDQDCHQNITNNQISLRPFSHHGFINEYEIASFSNEVIDKFDVRGTANGTSMARALSGGNQQKLIIGREVSKPHKLLIMVQPTRGLDVGAIEYIHNRIIQEKQTGNAILLISYELDEILALADTIAVIHRNEFVGVGSRLEMTRQRIGELLAGREI